MAVGADSGIICAKVTIMYIRVRFRIPLFTPNNTSRTASTNCSIIFFTINSCTLAKSRTIGAYDQRSLTDCSTVITVYSTGSANSCTVSYRTCIGLPRLRAAVVDIIITYIAIPAYSNILITTNFGIISNCDAIICSNSSFIIFVISTNTAISTKNYTVRT